MTSPTVWLAGEDQGADVVDDARPARSYKTGRLRKLHHRRTLQRGSGAHPGAVQYRGFDSATLDEHRTVPDDSAAVRLLLQQIWQHTRHRGSEPQVHDLDWLVVDPVPVPPLVLGVECSLQFCRGRTRHGQFERLTGVPQVGQPLRRRGHQVGRCRGLQCGEPSFEIELTHRAADTERRS